MGLSTEAPALETGTGGFVEAAGGADGATEAAGGGDGTTIELMEMIFFSGVSMTDLRKSVIGCRCATAGDIIQRSDGIRARVDRAFMRIFAERHAAGTDGHADAQRDAKPP